MKVAISLPDPVFSAAEKLANQLRVSRSQLYAQALQEYLGKRQDALITERLNAVHGAIAESVDPALAAAQFDAIEHETWWDLVGQAAQSGWLRSGVQASGAGRSE